MVRAKLQDGTFTSSCKTLFGSDPLFLTLRCKRGPAKPRKPRTTMDADPALETFFFACNFNEETRIITYRPASGNDLQDIKKFVDFWLSGGAKRQGIPGAGKDYFVPTGQHVGYLKYKTTYIAVYDHKIIGWAVKSKNQTLIHLLVTAEYRGKGVGRHLVEILDPSLVRSKSDQSTGDPLAFYKKLGYEIIQARAGKHKNIDIMRRSE